MDKDEFMDVLTEYAMKYFYFGRSINVPDSVALMASYNVRRLYFETDKFDGTNMDWDFVFTGSFWVANKALLDECFELKDLCKYVNFAFTNEMFLNLEYLLIKSFGFDLGYQFVRST